MGRLNPDFKTRTPISRTLSQAKLNSIQIFPAPLNFYPGISLALSTVLTQESRMHPKKHLQNCQSIRIFGTALFACLGLGSAQLTWQTTHTTNGGFNQGQALLIRNQAKVTVYPNYLDVEEEIEIATQGTVNAGNDPATLEIVAMLSLSPEAAIVGGLLWNGDTVLGAKLLSKAKADSLYEEQVDRNSVPPPRPRDPLLLEELSAGNYRARIYPVALGSTRRMRLRYHIPPLATPKGIYLPVRTLLANNTPQVTIHLVGTEAAKEAIVIQGNTARSITFPRSFILTATDFNLRQAATPTEHGNASLLIQPGDAPGQMASLTQISKGGMSGQYINLQALVPEVVVNMAKLVQLPNQNNNPVVIATVRNSEHAYDLSVSCSGIPMACSPLVFHGKSTKPWDSTITWTVYDKQGEILETILQKPKVFKQAEDTTSAVIWAASIMPFSEGRENPLGPVYGFVDGWASLLALEKDAMNAKQQAAFAASGVPRISNAFFQDVLPNYNAQTPNPNLPVTDLFAKSRANIPLVTASLTWKKTNAHHLQVSLPSETTKTGFAKVILVGLNGKSQNLGEVYADSNGLLNMRLDGIQPGIYWLRIQWHGHLFSARIIW
jgi:hypothetical protein